MMPMMICLSDIMDVKRSINTRMWADPWFENLDPDFKLVWIYLLTNQQTNMLGIYEISERRVSNETSVPMPTVRKAFEGFAKASKGLLLESGYVVIVNWLKNQKLNPNMEKSCVEVWRKMPSEAKKEVLERLDKGFVKALQSLPKIEIEIEVEIESEKEKNNSQNKDFAEQEFSSHPSETMTAFKAEQSIEKQEQATKDLDKAEQVKLEVYPTFGDFWEIYDKKRGDQAKIKVKWDKLRQEEKENAIEYIPSYIEAQPEKQFRKDPGTFLNNKSWNDEIITNSTTKNRNNEQSSEERATRINSIHQQFQNRFGNS
jgi:hypothetical protein